MPIRKPEEFRRHLAPGARLMGLDLGTKSLGVAISDDRLTIASPLTTLRRGKLASTLESLAGLAAERGAGGFVLGLPINMDGSQGPACDRVRSFADMMIKAPALFGPGEAEIALWDERLSTAAVERMMRDEADMSRARRAEQVDARAAAWILQGALDAIRAADNEEGDGTKAGVRGEG